MARIPTAELDRLKREVSLERLVEAKGIKLKRHGKDLIGLCPFHDDKDPSLVVSPQKNLWHCLGACQAGGDVIQWVMKAESVSFRHAVEMLREDSPSLAANFQKPRGRRSTKENRTVAKHTTVPKLGAVIERDAEIQKQLCQVVEYYHETLKQSPEALSYLERRGLKSSEMIDRFKLGFCNRTLGYRLPQKNRKEGAEVRSALQEVGILRRSGHEHFRGSLVIPVMDEHGMVTEVYGRKVQRALRAGTERHLYLPGPHRGVWNLPALEASKEVILCESLIDALTFWCAGYRNVTSSYGIEGFTKDHLEAFKRYGTERVLIAYDRDKAGDKAAEALAKKLTAAGIDCYRIQFPKGMDANEYALMVQSAQQSLGVAIRSAVWMGKGQAPKAAPTSTAAATPTPTPTPTAPSGTTTITESTPGVSNEPPAPLAAREEAEETTTETDRPPSSAPSPAPSANISAEVKAEEVVMRFGDRLWRVRGLRKNTSYEVLRVNVLCAKGDAYHVDSLDLYSARHRAIFLKQATDELDIEEKVLKKDLGKVLLKLEELQDQQIQAAQEPKEQTPTLTEAERGEALELLRDPNLLDRILTDFEHCGVVGEETNKLCGYLAAVSRKLESPLALIIQSSSAAGKSSLMDAILSFMPPEERVQYSAMTGQSLFYMGETDLKHKILAIVEEEGAERAAYALKLLQSEGELTIASTGKDPTTGKLVTHEYRVEGPVMIFLTTTAIDIDEELLNRCLVLTVNEARSQTAAIHSLQRGLYTVNGLASDPERAAVIARHRNAQRLLAPLHVVNPYATQLTFRSDRVRTRRDHVKYLDLISSVALLHQHQRSQKSIQVNAQRLEYIEVTVQDIAVANRLTHEVLGRSLDELAPQTRRLLESLEQLVTERSQLMEMEREDYRFTRKEVREHSSWSDFQVRVHLERLVELEYVLAHRGKRGQRFVYELVYDGGGKTGERYLIGLVDVSTLRPPTCDYDTKFEGQGSEFEPPLRVH